MHTLRPHLKVRSQIQTWPKHSHARFLFSLYFHQHKNTHFWSLQPKRCNCMSVCIHAWVHALHDNHYSTASSYCLLDEHDPHFCEFVINQTRLQLGWKPTLFDQPPPYLKYLGLENVQLYQERGVLQTQVHKLHGTLQLPQLVEVVGEVVVCPQQCCGRFHVTTALWKRRGKR